ncbi:MAG: NAD(P)H-dependent oxidoreductase, partial [Campylobacterales bacterium]
MKNVLLLNLHQKYEGFANGELTQLILNETEKYLVQKGLDVKKTHAEAGYSVDEELEKFKWADFFFVQSPVYWMGLPWLGKKYIDEIFTGGMGKVTFNNDGRSKDDPTKKYGSGGLMKDKSYMLSFTYNCPSSEFDNPNGFFEGLSVDGANIALHKAFQFCGAKKLESYSIHDVYSDNLDIESEKIKL